MRRRRRVRYVYPQAMMDLTIALSLRHGKRAATELLSLPLSTLYRWLDLFRRDPMRFSGVEHAQSDEGLRHLIGACQAHGFNIRGDLEMVSGPIKSERRLLADDDAPARNRVASSNPNRFAHPSQTGLSQQQDFDRVFANLESGNRISLPAQIRMEHARARIDMGYYSKLSCEALARMTNMSKWHFIRMFSAAYGTSPYHYLTRVRVLKAKHLLYTTSHSLEAIASCRIRYAVLARQGVQECRRHEFVFILQGDKNRNFTADRAPIKRCAFDENENELCVGPIAVDADYRDELGRDCIVRCKGCR